MDELVVYHKGKWQNLNYTKVCHGDVIKLQFLSKIDLAEIVSVIRKNRNGDLEFDYNVIYTLPMFDMLGNKIKHGDVITYPVRHGSDMRMNFAIVKEIVKNNDNESKLKIFVYKEDFDYYIDGQQRYIHEVIPTFKQSTLYRTDRCIILDRQQKNDIYYDPDNKERGNAICKKVLEFGGN